MSITAPHPHLSLPRPLTETEMMEALRYEITLGIGERDLPVARVLADRGELILEECQRGRGWHICLPERP